MTRFGPFAKMIAHRRVLVRCDGPRHSHPTFRVRRSIGNCL